MTIEYKDSKRIVKKAQLSADTTGTQVTASNGVVSFDITTRTTNQAVTYDIGSNLSDSAWVMRAKLDYVAITGGSGSTAYLELGVGSASSSTAFANGGITQDFIGLQQRKASDADGWGLVGYNSTGGLDNPESPLMDAVPNTSTTYYVEIKRLTDESMSIGLYTTSSYGTLISGIALETKNISSGVIGLRYIRVGNAGMISETAGNVIEGTVTDVEIWDGVTTASGDSTYTIYEPKPTNVQDNSILVEKDTGKRYWFDISKDSTKDGTNSNITLDTTNEKLGTGCYDFNGSTSRSVTSVKFNGLHDNTGGSISFWMRPRNMSSIHVNGDYIFDSMATSAANGTGISIAIKNTSLLRVNFTTSSNAWFTDINSTTTFSNNTWYHVVMTFGSNTVKLYINGSQEDTATFSNPNTNASNGNFVIGRHSTDPSSYGYYDGLLDDTGIWNRVLTSSEVTSLYNSGTGALASSISTTDFAGYYNYDAVTGDKLENQIITASKKGTTTKTFDHSGDSSLSVRSVSNSTNWWEAPRQGLLIEAGHSAVGTYVKKISLPLSKTGIPTGNYTFAIRDSSETIKGSATGVANDLTTSYVITEVTLNTAVLIAVGDHITIEYNDTIPATGKLNFPTSSISGWISGTDQQNWINSAWQGDGDGAGAGRVWQFTFDSTPASFEEFWQEEI